MKSKSFRFAFIMLFVVAVSLVSCSRGNPVDSYVDYINETIEIVKRTKDLEEVGKETRMIDIKINFLVLLNSGYNLTDGDRRKITDVYVRLTEESIIRGMKSEGLSQNELDYAREKMSPYLLQMAKDIDLMIYTCDTLEDAHLAMDKMGDMVDTYFEDASVEIIRYI